MIWDGKGRTDGNWFGEGFDDEGAEFEDYAGHGGARSITVLGVLEAGRAMFIEGRVSSIETDKRIKSALWPVEGS